MPEYRNPELDEIYKINEYLYIGAYWPRLNFKKMEQEGIKAIVNLMEHKHYHPPLDKFKYLFKGFPDNTYPSHELLSEVLAFIDQTIKEDNKKLLVHCAMGISRSGGMCVAWLLKEHPNWSWSQAVAYVRRVRNIIPAVEIRESILDYLETINGFRRDI